MIPGRSTVTECEITGEEFELSAEQVEAYESFDLPLPKIAPEERFRHQLAFRNEIRFFWRRCSGTSEKILSVFPAQTDFPVFKYDLWKSDEWDPLAYGNEFTFDRLFVDQLSELWASVPRPAFSGSSIRDSNAVHAGVEVDSGFYLFSALRSKQSLYSSFLSNCSDCLDSHALNSCELCYESTHLKNCSRVLFSESSTDCRDCWFISNCSSCQDCLFCTNLENRKYHIFNQAVTREVYERSLREWNFSSRANLDLAKERFRHFLADKPLPWCVGDTTSSVSGNFLFGCNAAKNCYECFDSENISDCNCLVNSRNCVDGYGGSNLEDCAQFVSVASAGRGRARRVFNSIECYGNLEELAYCSYCEDCSNIFACVGLKNKEYCLFNKQYSRSEYFRRRTEIVNFLKQRKIWGGFFPASFSVHPYNHSAASVFTPLGKVPAMMMGFSWDESDSFIRPSVLASRKKRSQAERFSRVPDRLSEIDQKTLRDVIYLCQLSGKPFTFQAAELKLYEKLGVAPPDKIFEQRNYERIGSQPPKKLHARGSDATFPSSFPATWERPVLSEERWKALGEKGRIRAVSAAR